MSASSYPPRPNRGVTDTLKVSYLIDYFDITFYNVTIKEIVDAFNPEILPYRHNTISKGRFDNVSMWFLGATFYEGLSNKKSLPKTQNTTQKDLEFPDEEFDDKPEKGYLRLEIKGEGMRTLKELGFNDIETMTILYAHVPEKIGRIDFTIDVKAKLLDRVRSHFRNYAYTCFAKKIKAIDDIRDNRTETIYIGARSSTVRMTIYDKRQERLQKTGHDIGEEITRFELTVRDDKKGREASKMFKHMLLKESGSRGNKTKKAGNNLISDWVAVGLARVFKYIDFKDFRSAAKNKNKAKAHTAKWWRELMTEKKTKYRGNIFKELDESTWWSDQGKQIEKRIAVAYELYGPSIFHSLKNAPLGVKEKIRLAELKRQKEKRTTQTKEKREDLYYFLTGDEIETPEESSKK